MATAHPHSAQDFPHAHPVKTERHDPQRMLHHTNTGQRQVDHYALTPSGLFVARAFHAHPRIRHWQAHLLPALNLVVCQYQFHGVREHDFYIDVAQISREGEMWLVRDLYLDLAVWNGRAAQILDTDELLDSWRAGFIDAADLTLAVQTAHTTLAELSRAGYGLNDWARARGLRLDWLQPALPGEALPCQSVISV